MRTMEILHPCSHEKTPLCRYWAKENVRAVNDIEEAVVELPQEAFGDPQNGGNAERVRVKQIREN